MVPTRYTPTKADPLRLYIAAGILSLLTSVGLVLEKLFPPNIPELVKWRTLNEYKIESEKTKKPVLFVFSAAWCGPCHKMEAEAFSDKKIASYINDHYIPVMVIDQKREKGKNPPEIEDLQKRCDVDSFPTLVAVPYNLLEAKTKDIYSTGSKAEYDLVLKMLWPSFFEEEEEMAKSFSERFAEDYLESNHDRIPALAGYRDKASLERYFWKCRIWHRTALSRGKIAWQPFEKIGNGNTKPTLIAFVEDCGYSSDKMRLGLFESEDADKLINDNFNPVLLEFKRGKLETNNSKYIELKNKFKIKELPALVVLVPGKPPAVQDGFTSLSHSTQYLSRTLMMR